VIGERELQQLDHVLSQSTLALIAVDSNRRYSYWSPRAEEIFGFPAEQMLGKPAPERDFIHPDDVDRAFAVELPEGDEPLTIEVRNRRADGSTVRCRWTIVSTQPDDRYAVILFAEDVSHPHVDAEQLHESEERFRSLFANNPDTIMFFDPAGIVVDVNAALASFGHARPEMVRGLHFSEFIFPEDVPAHQGYLERALAGETLYYRTRAKTLSGRPIELNVTTVPVTRGGSIVGAFSIMRDETPTREAERIIQLRESQLAENDARLRSLVAHNPDAVLALDLDGHITDVNDAALRLGPIAREATIGKHYADFLVRQGLEAFERAFQAAACGEPTTTSFPMTNFARRRIAISATLIPQYLRDKVVGIYAVLQDVTERQAAEGRAEMQSQRIRNLYYIAASTLRPAARQRASLEMGATALGFVLGAVVQTAPQLQIIERHHASQGQDVGDDELFDLARRAVEEASPGPIVTERGIAMRIEAGQDAVGALVFAGPIGRSVTLADTDADLVGLIATLIAAEIERSRVREHMRALANFDALTGLPNRTFLSERVRDAIEVAESRLSRIGLLFLDLDGFKDVNDTLGHGRGDHLLQLVAERLKQLLGESMTLARMGGDEFMILIEDAADGEKARMLAERVLAALSEPFALDEYEQFISASVGIAIYPEDGRDDQTLIKNADIAMSRAKDRGRNGYYFYNPTLEAPIHMRLSQEKLLRRALALDEFVIFYQPLRDLRTGQIVSVEALVRWNHPKSGLILPGHFIPSAEISGLIVPLGDWVLERAARQVHQWRREFGPLRLAVNLSARQFHQRDLRARVLRTLESTGLEPTSLELEITESVAMSDAAQSEEIVRDLADHGIRIAVDDFGTGYSSLAYLRRFELDVLKIDGSFVSGVGVNSGDETIVNTVIGMAHSLNLEVVAEGVETPEQLDFLERHGCDLVQGHAIAPALPADEAERFLQRREIVPAAGYGD
jgi:diguanylate cyclase (GGDEF)-like protein/PAS domain S-box-containing protein